MAKHRGAGGRVAICAVAQTKFERDKWQVRFQGMLWEVVEKVLRQTGLQFGAGGIEAAVTVSDDVFDARTISDGAITDVVGAHHQSEEKVAADGAQGVYYAAATILSNHHDIVLLAGHCKESQSASRNQITHLAFDPFYTRPVGLDYVAAAALQAQAYMARTGVTEAQLADVVVRSRKWARENPVAQETAAVTREQALAAPMLAAPIRQSFMYPVSDGAIAMILASEERAAELTDRPVWITGLGNCYDSFFLGERDLAGNFSLERAAKKAYEMAGVTHPTDAFEVVEIADQYAHQQPQYAEGLALCPARQGAKWLADGGPEKQHVNRSGGMLAGNPLILGGMARVAEAVIQLRGEAGSRQVPGAKRALAHGATGPAGQLQTVVVLEN
ncbi:MAG: thiolase family protein [Candidatus Hydrogenedentes bacterium]|nr:thiolase family protein [Candidatus Hydrogenedentota bacterium]